MTRRQKSGTRTFAGLALAILVAPVVTAFCVNVAILLPPTVPAFNLSDEIGGTLTFLVFALVFGGLLAAIPVLALGSIAIMIARHLGTRSPVFYAAAGLLAGSIMAWIDTGRTKSVFNMLEAIPFVIGGCLSALAYWSVAER